MSRMVDTRGMSARDIERMLQKWAINGRITSKTIQGRDYTAISKKYGQNELLITSIDGIDVLDKAAQKTFEELHDQKRIMTKREVMLRLGLQTIYALNREVKKGNVLRFDVLGRSSILYIM